MFRAIFFILISSSISFTSALTDTCFRAAVLDHVHQTKGSPSENLDANLKVYEDATVIAKKDGADIIVFPENGLLYRLISRNEASKFSVDIPDPEDVKHDDLCTLNSKLVLNRLSCMAQKNQIFLAANIIDRKTCDEMNIDKNSKLCPRDDKFLFNTAVLFDRNGTLIAKYHKMHLFFEFNMNPAPKPELIVIDTELGRLSFQICFDMIFDLPGHQLAEEKRYDTMIFPTWWFDEAPFLSSSQYQMAWAFGNKVNLLASNIHFPVIGSRGSGIYIGSTKKFANAIFNDLNERLVIANVPKTSSNDCDLDSKIIIVPQQIKIENSTRYNHKNINLRNTKLVKIDFNKNDENKLSECFNGVCCEIEFLLDESMQSNDMINEQVNIADTNQINNDEYTVCRENDDINDDNTNCKSKQYSTISTLISNEQKAEKPLKKFHLFVTNRTRSAGYPWTEEFCSFVTCADIGCTRFSTEIGNEISFRYFKLKAEFSTGTTVYPSVLDGNGQLIHPDKKQWIFKTDKNSDKQISILEFGNKESKDGNSLSVIALYGRDYQRDPQLTNEEIRELEEAVKKERKTVQM